MDASHLEASSTKDDGPVAPIPVTRQQQGYIRRMYDRRMLPIVCTLYVLSYLDRGNIGNAKTAGADDDLGLDSQQWTWILNAFYICYVLFEWTTVLWKILPAHIYVAVLCLCWGTAAMSSGSVKNQAHLIVCRCFLGIFEASFGAGAPYYLSLFYQRRELAFRVSLLLGMSPLANCFAGALAYGITHIKHGIEPWRWLFISKSFKSFAIPNSHMEFTCSHPCSRRSAHSPLCPRRLLLPPRLPRPSEVPR